jgi:acyl-CoA thioesterase FadM
MRVRSYEVDRHGRLAASTVLRYLEAIATEHSASLGFDFSWYERQGTAWVVRDMYLRLGALPSIGEDLLVATWVSDYRRVQAARDYAIWCPRSSRPVARASARWAYVDRVRGQPQRLFDGFPTIFPQLGSRLISPTLQPPAEVAPTRERHTLALTAREYEMDSQGHVNNCVYLDWLAEGNCGARGIASRTWRPRDVRIEYIRQLQAGDALSVLTTVERRSARGLSTWQEVLRDTDGAPCVRARSRYLVSRT